MLSIRKVMAACIGAAACIALAACSSGGGSATPDKCCEVSVTGADGYAKVKVYPDYTELRYAIYKGMPADVTTKDRDKANDFAETIKFEVENGDELENLSNGDEITVNVIYDKEKAKKDFNFSFSSDSFKYTVEDLEKAEPIDPFDGFDVKFSGFSPRATYTLNTDNCSSIVRNYVYFEVEDAPDHVANGDTITVNARSYGGDDSYLMNMGYVLSRTSKTYTVSGLEEGKTIDPFANIVIEYTGISPKASVKIDTSKCEDYVRNNVRFDVSYGYIANGESFTVYAYYDDYKAEQNGIVFTSSEKTYTAEGIPFYMNAPDGVDFAATDPAIKDFVEQKLAKSNIYKGSDNIYISSINGDSSCKYRVEKLTIKPAKRMVLIPKNVQDSYYSNVYLVVYQVDGVFKKTNANRYCSCGIEEGATVKGTFYVAAYLYNLAVSDGKAVMPDGTSLSTEIYWPSDYSNLSTETITEKWRTQNLADYNITISDVASNTTSDTTSDATSDTSSDAASDTSSDAASDVTSDVE